MIITGIVLVLLISSTLFILIACGQNMGTEGTGFFNLILIADLIAGVIFYTFYRIEKLRFDR